MDVTAFQEIGLTNGESRVYLTLLEIGESTVGPIIVKSRVTKSSIYQVLEKLMQKGLISYVVREKRKYFQAGQPERLLDFVKESEERLHKKRDDLQKLLPQLKSLERSAKESTVKTYTGFKGIVTVHEHTYERLKRGDEYFYLGIAAVQPEYFYSYWAKDHRRRAKAGITCRLLFNPNTSVQILLDRKTTSGCDARLMPVQFPTPAWILGYNDVTAIGISGENAVAIEIVNHEIAKAFREYFEQFWTLSKPYKQPLRSKRQNSTK